MEGHEQRLLTLEREFASHEEQFKNIAKRTTDVSSIRISPAAWGVSMMLCASIIGGFYASTYGMRDDITVIKSGMASQEELRKAEAKLEDARNQALTEAMREIKARGEMTDLKVNNLRETVLTRRQ